MGYMLGGRGFSSFYAIDRTTNSLPNPSLLLTQAAGNDLFTIMEIEP